MEKKLHPDLQKVFSVLPKMNFDRENLEEIRKQIDDFYAEMNASQPLNESVSTTERFISGPVGDPDVRVKVYEPKVKNDVLPGILYIHGGGYLVGTPEMNDMICQDLVQDINAVIVSVDYRLAPEHPFPAPVEDCYAALEWFSENAEGLGVDPARIAVMGASSGGGLTAAVSLLARDRKGPAIALQMPLYPMIDDRAITPSSSEIHDERVWNTTFNRQGWEMYLGTNTDEVSPYAAPARATDFSGLPPTYTFIGDLDTFRDETIEYVAKLTQAGVPVEFHLYPGCYHGFEELDPTAAISQRALKEINTVLRNTLHTQQVLEK